MKSRRDPINAAILRKSIQTQQNSIFCNFKHQLFIDFALLFHLVFEMKICMAFFSGGGNGFPTPQDFLVWGGGACQAQLQWLGKWLGKLMTNS